MVAEEVGADRTSTAGGSRRIESLLPTLISGKRRCRVCSSIDVAGGDAASALKLAGMAGTGGVNAFSLLRLLDLPLLPVKALAMD